ncbi:MAG TPA: hypothetical protein VJK25_01600 [Patescibacteria group bacterium]|nr:hypothetical protein [Patescibacteria group bacterium]
MIKNKKDYLSYFQALRKIINKHDPMSLMDAAPEDEYDMEVEKILASTYRLNSLAKIEKIIYDTFVNNFGDEARIAEDLYHKIAKEWLEIK